MFLGGCIVAGAVVIPHEPAWSETFVEKPIDFSGGVVFTVEWSDMLAPNSWSSALVARNILTENGTIQTLKGSVPGGTDISWHCARIKVTPGECH